jgi:hypothetical protein
MNEEHFALIGHSGSGKSSCLRALGISQDVAEMDRGLGVAASPPAEVALEWIVKTKQPVAVVGVHRELLKTIGQRIEEIRASYPKIRFVYLRKTKAELEANLRANCGGAQPLDQSY